MESPAFRAEFSADVYLAELSLALRDLDRSMLQRIAHLFCFAHAAGRTVFCCGNGGSAAIAAHWAADLSKLTAELGRPRLRVVCLTDSVSALTAAANDFDYGEVFVDQLRTFMSPGDVVIGISTSGKSENVLRAMDYANQHGATSIGITGSSGEPLHRLARETLVIQSTNVQRIEDVTTVAAHLACLMTRQMLAETPVIPFEVHSLNGRVKQVAQ